MLERPEHFNLACMLPWYGTPEPRLRVDHRLAPGSKLSWRGFEFEFFLLGGQTRRHLGISTTIDERKTLLVGDGWYGTSPEPTPPLCWNDAPPHSGGWVFALDQMILRQPDLLVAGHGCAISRPLPLLQQTRDNWTRRLAAFDRLNPHASEEPFFSPFHRHGNK